VPYVQLQDIQLSYRIYGRKRNPADLPLLLIAGLGFATWSWFKQAPVLATQRQVIVFDNRGSGQSEKPRRSYSVATLADDAAGLLDRLGVERAHVLGASLGGFVAQELALRYPERVGRLILCCTSFGGPGHVPMNWPALMATMGWGALSQRQAVRRGLAVATSDAYRATHPDELEQIARWRQNDQLAHSDYVLQLMAGARFDASPRAHTIAAPTLIVHGADDQVVPIENARRLAEAIPGAQLRIFENAGHLVFIEQADAVNQAILRFIAPAPLPAPRRLAEGLRERWLRLRGYLARGMRALAGGLPRS
jgi:pimeloyl-ACP methyl ester carboxylesterase